MPESKISPADIQLLKRESEVHSEFLARERLERKAEVEQLRIELEALRQALEMLFPDFPHRYRSSYSKSLQEFNPEAGTEFENRHQA